MVNHLDWKSSKTCCVTYHKLVYIEVLVNLNPNSFCIEKMGMNKFVWLLLLILVSIGKWHCEGCWKEERDALLQLKASFIYPSRLMEWVDGTDCCQWDAVECNTTTNQVAQLDLSSLWSLYDVPDGYRWHLDFSYFRVFEDLESLDLSFNNIGGCVQNLGRHFSLIPSKDLSLIFNYLKILVLDF